MTASKACGPSRQGILSRMRGFTMIELMVGLLLSAILTAIAMPLYRSYVDNQRMRAVSSDLHIALVMARSEAVKRARAIVVTPSADGWGAGWVIASPTPGDPAILNQSQSGSVAIAGPAQVQFNAFGRAAGEVEFEIDIGVPGSSVISCMTMQADGRTKLDHGGCPDEEA